MFRPRQLQGIDLSLPQDNTATILAGLGNTLTSAYDQGRKRLAEDQERQAALEVNNINLSSLGMPQQQQQAAIPQQTPLSALGTPRQEQKVPQFAQMQGNQPNQSIRELVQRKEAASGLPAGFLTRTAEIESSFNPNAKNPNSSASGLFQFINSTAKQYGLTNPFDPEASTEAVTRLALDNRKVLMPVLGREPENWELYLAHQQGGGGAAKLLANPNARAVDIVGEDAVRLNGGDANMSAAQFAAKWQQKFNGGQQTASAPAQGATEAQGFFAPQQGQQPQKSARVQELERQYRILATRAQETGNSAIAKKAEEIRKNLIEAQQKETYGFQAFGDQLLRTDPRTGQAEVIMNKPSNSLEEQKKRLDITKAQRDLDKVDAPNVQRVKQPDGSEVAVQWDQNSQSWMPLAAPQGGNPVAKPKLTEQQSKDVGLYTRGSRLLERMDKQQENLLGWSALGSKVGGSVPLVGNAVKTDAFRQAENTGKDFLAIILRKDSGAAVTDPELATYGDIFIPKVGDDNGTLRQKSEARKAAMEGIKLGLGSADIIFNVQEKMGMGQKPQQQNATPQQGKSSNGIQWSVE